MENWKTVFINKNRGWRGLAELQIWDDAYKIQHRMLFSFSSDTWEDLLNGYIVTQDKDNYYVIKFNCTTHLPAPEQQRSVLIKNFIGSILGITKYRKAEWRVALNPDWSCISHFIKNKNNHTQSQWNYVGVRVTPSI